MEVILLKDVKGVGKKDQTVTVSDGYANNFLFKQHLAVKVSKKSVEVLSNQQEQARENEARLVLEAKQISAKLEQIELSFSLKSGTGGRTFGSISTKQIAEELENKYAICLNKQKFIDKGPFNTLGYYNIQVELHKGVIGKVKVHIVEEN